MGADEVTHIARRPEGETAYPAFVDDVIRARVDAASRGPWVVRAHPDRDAVTIYAPKGGGYVIHPFLGYVNDAADAEFIAHAREDVPGLLAEVERLRRLVGRLEAIAREPYEPDEFAVLAEARREITRA